MFYSNSHLFKFTLVPLNEDTLFRALSSLSTEPVMELQADHEHRSEEGYKFLSALPKKAADTVADQGIKLHARAKKAGLTFARRTDFSFKEFSPDVEWILGFCEDVYGLLMTFRLSRDTQVRTFAILKFAKSISGEKSFALQIMRRADFMMKTKFGKQSFSTFMDIGRRTVDSIKTIRNSEFSKRLTELVLFILTTGIFTKMGLRDVVTNVLGHQRVKAAYTKYGASSFGDIIELVTNCVFFVANAGYQAWQGHDISRIIHGPNEYVEFHDKVDVLVQDFERYESTGISADVEHSRLLTRVRELLLTLDSIQNTIRDPKHVKVVTGVSGRLKMIRSKLLNVKVCQANRQAPFSILIHGESSVGKTTLSHMIFDYYGKLMNLPTGSEYCYNRTPTAEYWDGFDSSMWCIKLDDIAFLHPKAAKGLDPTIAEVIQIINANPYTPNQAALEAKGTRPCLARLVIATTNVKQLNVNSYFSEPGAALRRFPYVITASIKDEYCTDGIWTDKTPRGTIPNFWNLLVERVDPPHGDRVRVGEFTDIQEFYRWLRSIIEVFNVDQRKVEDSVKGITNESLCPSCKLPTSLCGCMVAMEMQSQTLRANGPLFFGLTMALGATGAMFYLSIKKIQDILSNERRAIFSQVQAHIADVEARVQEVLSPEALLDTSSKVAHSVVDSVREKFREMGDYVRDQIIQVPPLLVMITTIVGAGLFLKMLTNYVSDSNPEVQSAEAHAPIPIKKEPRDYYYNDNMEMSKFYGSAADSIPAEVFIQRIIRPNVICVEFYHGRNNVTVGRCLAIGGQYYLTNNHMVPKGVKKLTYVKGIDHSGVAERFSPIFTESDVSRYPEKDLAVIRIVGVPARKDLRKYFSTEVPSGRCDGSYIDRTPEGVSQITHMTNITFSHNKCEIGNLFCARGEVPERTMNGQCGMPLVGVLGKSKVILGIHSMGEVGGVTNFYRKTYAAATVVLQSDLEKMIGFFAEPVVSGEDPVLSSQSLDRQITTLHPKSCFRYIEWGTLTVYGSFAGYRPRPKSNVIPSPIAEVAKLHGITTDFCKPDMVSWRPWRIAALDMTDPVTEVDPSVLRKCTDSYLDDVLRLLPEGRLEQILEKYDEFTALNGAEGVAYIDKLNRNTSAGAPFRQSKRYHLKMAPPKRGLQDPVEMLPEMADRVEHIRQRYKRGECYSPVFTAVLKDEPVSARKAKIGKTRVFCAAPMDWSVVVREYFLSHVRLIQLHQTLFECAVGIVAQSRQWDDLYKFLTAHGEGRIVAGDYSAYDKRMSPLFIKEAFRILIVLAEKSGKFDAQDLRAMLCIANDTACPLVDYNGDLVQFWGSNPSGHPLTVIINSLANSLYVRFCYHQAGFDLSTFKENVNLITYGDDNIMGIKEGVDFNHTTLVRQLDAVGVKYTMADKEAESRPYIHIREATFLKRRWFYNADVCCYTGPLEIESIHKMLCVITKSKTITIGEQITEIIRSAHMEWWHHGRAVFQEQHDILEDIIDQCELRSYFIERPLCTFSDYLETFEKNSLNTEREF